MRVFKKSFGVLATFFSIFFIKVSYVFGQIGDPHVGFDASGWFEDVFIWIIGLAGTVAVAVLIFNAYLYITASGDEGKVVKATKGITYAIVGLIVAAVAFLIVNFVIDAI